MSIRKAKPADTDRIMDLLLQVLTVHHNGRPDIFKANATKYTVSQLEEIMEDENTPIFVCTDEKDVVIGYCFCVFKQMKDDNILTDIKTLYIDDLCVDENARGQHVGTRLYDYVLDFARKSGCYNVTLNVWSCNDSAMKFYQKRGLVPQKVGMEVIL